MSSRYTLRYSANAYQEYLTRTQAQYGADFDARGLSTQFTRYFHTGVRLRVRTMFGEVTGTIGVTTGWRPVFLLMQRSNSMGSVITLSDADTILAVKVGRVYKPVA